MIDLILFAFVLAVAIAGMWIGWNARGKYATFAELKASLKSKAKDKVDGL